MAGPDDDPTTHSYRELPQPITLAETGTTHDTSVADAYESLGTISARPLGVPIGPDGGDADGGGD